MGPWAATPWLSAPRAALAVLSVLALFVGATPAAQSAEDIGRAATGEPEAGCSKGNGERCLDLGVRLLEGAHSADATARAVDYFLRGCELLSGAACGKAAANLAAAAPGASPDWPRVAALFDRGCGLQDAWSCQTGGMIYYAGSPGVPKDWVRARSMFTAGCGDTRNLVAKSCRYAATMYFAGQGGEKNEDIAKLMFKRGCDKQDAPSCKVLNLPAPN